jgi:hypothetical protein
MDTSLDPDVSRKLRTANVVVGLLHLAQAALILALSAGFAIAVTARYADGPPGTPPGEPFELFDVAFAGAVALFLALAALDHLLMAAPGVHQWYERKLSQGINPARWVEYSVSASLMVVLIAMLTGITEIYALVGIAGVNTAMILFGWLMERANPDRSRVDWLPFVFGCIAGIVPWIAIAIAIVGSQAEYGGVPTFVFAIFVSLFVLFNSFAVNQWLQYRGVGRWRNYVFGEGVYIVLSLVAKSALAWQVFGGTLAD